MRGWRWKIVDGPPLPPFDKVLPVAEAVRDMAQEARFVLCGSCRLPACLHGPNPDTGSADAATQQGGRKEHSHAFWLPEDMDADGNIDHILVHAHAGLDPAAVRTLACCHRLTLAGIGTWELSPEWMGWQGAGGLYGPAQVWLSRTPWFPPGNVHRLDCKQMIARELNQRGFPEALAIEPLGTTLELDGRCIRVANFHASRSNGTAPKRKAEGSFVRLTFAKPLAGPLCLGFAAHFGLGQFAPVV